MGTFILRPKLSLRERMAASLSMASVRLNPADLAKQVAEVTALRSEDPVRSPPSNNSTSNHAGAKSAPQ